MNQYQDTWVRDYSTETTCIRNLMTKIQDDDLTMLDSGCKSLVMLVVNNT
jgi:hypothetical protein